MNGLENIPKYVRYDFLITLLGLIFLGSWWYFSTVVKIDSASVSLLFITGLSLVVWGFGEMYSNYEEEKNLRQLQITLEQKEIFEKLLKQKLISDNEKKSLINSLRKKVKEMVGEDKENKK